MTSRIYLFSKTIQGNDIPVPPHKTLHDKIYYDRN